MTLSDSVILNEMEKGNIVISPFTRKNLGPNSYDMTLAKTCKVYRGETGGAVRHLDTRKPNPVEEFDIPEEGFTLQPGELYLYACNETIGVKKDICATVMGKSSLGRLGLDIHVCAGFIDTGFEGSLVLEMRTIYPLRIYPGMKICQIKFERVEGQVHESYDQKADSKYHGQQGVVESKYHLNG